MPIDTPGEGTPSILPTLPKMVPSAAGTGKSICRRKGRGYREPCPGGYVGACKRCVNHHICANGNLHVCWITQLLLYFYCISQVAIKTRGKHQNWRILLSKKQMACFHITGGGGGVPPKVTNMSTSLCTDIYIVNVSGVSRCFHATFSMFCLHIDL